MELVLKAVFSTFAIIFLGYFAGKFKILGENSGQILAKFVYYFALPAILFVAMADEPLAQSLNLPFIYAFLLSSILVYFFGFGTSIFFKPNSLAYASMRGFTMSSPNVAYMGMPILMTLFGKPAILAVALSTILCVVVMMLTIFIVEIYNCKNQSVVSLGYKILATFIKNPLVVAPLLGILFALIGWKLPTLITDLGRQLGATAGPCALFAIGQNLIGGKIFTEKFESGVMGFGKLILHPLLMLALIPVFHLTPFWAASGFILAALPCAAAIYVVADKYKIYAQRASALIFETTLCSIITVAIVITIAAALWSEALLIC